MYVLPSLPQTGEAASFVQSPHTGVDVFVVVFVVLGAPMQHTSGPTTLSPIGAVAQFGSHVMHPSHGAVTYDPGVEYPLVTISHSAEQGTVARFCHIVTPVFFGSYLSLQGRFLDGSTQIQDV
jgi:hypothetical protein